MNSASTPRATSEDVFLMLSRIALGSAFLYAGALKAFDLGAAGIQAAGIAAALQIAGGAAVVLGWRIGPAATALALLTACAILGGRHDWLLAASAPTAAAALHALVIGGFAALALRGPGRLSLDWARALQQKQ